MTIVVAPITPGFGAEIGDVDLSRPLVAEDLEAIKQAFWTHAVLVFPDQHLDHAQHLAFARHFGPHETTIAVHRPGGDRKLRAPKEFADVSNLDGEGRVWGRESRVRMFQMANRVWHTDSSFKALPAIASFLHARTIPSIGGHTEFADERAAYDALPETTKRRLEGLVAEHSIMHSRGRLGFTAFTEEERRGMPPVPQVLVRTLPQTGRRTLYLASHAGRIFGLPAEAGRALIDELIAHATRRQFVYTHRWRVNDLVMWDNRCTLHRGTPFDDLRWPRDLLRATVSDVAGSCEQEGVAAPRADAAPAAEAGTFGSG